MSSFATNHDKYLDPPDDDPICEDGCGETLTKDMWGDWYCANRYCPNKFQGVEREIAEMLIGRTEEVIYLREQLRRLTQSQNL